MGRTSRATRASLLAKAVLPARLPPLDDIGVRFWFWLADLAWSAAPPCRRLRFLHGRLRSGIPSPAPRRACEAHRWIFDSRPALPCRELLETLFDLLTGSARLRQLRPHSFQCQLVGLFLGGGTLDGFIPGHPLWSAAHGSWPARRPAGVPPVRAPVSVPGGPAARHPVNCYRRDHRDE